MFLYRPPPHSPTNMAVHTLSNRTITKEELNIKDKGLCFATMDMTPQPTQQLQLLHHFNDFTESLSNLRSQTTLQNNHYLTTTAKVYRPITFILKPTFSTITQQYTGQLKLEQYIETNKIHLNDNLQLLPAQTAHNLTTTEWKTVKNLKTASLH